MIDHADEEHPEERAGRGERAQRRRDAALGGHRAGDGQDRDDHREAADEHGQPAGHVVEGRVAGQAGEGRAVVARLAGVGVEDLAEAVRARRSAGRPGPPAVTVARPVKPRMLAPRTRTTSIAIFISKPSTFLPRYSGVRPTISPAMKTDEDRAEDEHAVEARADAAGRDLAELHEEERHEASHGLEAVVHGVHGPGAGAGGDGREQPADAGAEAQLLALHVARGPGRRRPRTAGLPPGLAGHGHDGADDEEPAIAAKIAQPWRWSPAIRPKV